MESLTKKPEIGIVTVLYNSAAVVNDFFETLNLQTFKNFVLYVIDNNSPDNSLVKVKELAKQVFFKVVIFEEQKNWGVAKGNNIGIEAALADGCEYVLLSNNDVVLERTTLKQLLQGMLKMGASMAVPKIYFHDTGLLWAAGGSFVYRSGSTRHFGTDQKDFGQFEIPKQIEYSPTCFMLIHRSVFERVGFMDENYFVYYDDTDFVWRATKIGSEKLFYIPTSCLWHKESSCTEGTHSDFTIRFMNRNLVYFAMKHFSFSHKMVIILYHVLHYWMRERKRMNPAQKKIMRKSYKEGYYLYKNTVQQ